MYNFTFCRSQGHVQRGLAGLSVPCLIGLITRSWPVELFSGGSGKNLFPNSLKLLPNQIFYTCITEVHIFMMAISWESPYLLGVCPGPCIGTGPSQSQQQHFETFSCLKADLLCCCVSLACLF